MSKHPRQILESLHRFEVVEQALFFFGSIVLVRMGRDNVDFVEKALLEHVAGIFEAFDTSGGTAYGAVSGIGGMNRVHRDAQHSDISIRKSILTKR